MEEVEGNQVAINVRSFAGASVTLKVGKKEGMEDAELLAEESPAGVGEDIVAPSGLWDTLSRYTVHSACVSVTAFLY